LRPRDAAMRACHATRPRDAKVAVHRTSMRHTVRMQLPRRLADLVVKNGVGLGVLSADDRDLVLALAASRLEPRRIYREDEVNRLLMDWLATDGAMLRTDHVELRRWLVDTGFVARDGYGHAYTRGPAELQRAHALLGGADAATLGAAVRATRATAVQARRARRKAFEAGTI